MGAASGGSTGRRSRSPAGAASAPTRVCAPPVDSATAKTRPVAASYAIVPVMPSGSMLPHGRSAFGHRRANVRGPQHRAGAGVESVDGVVLGRGEDPPADGERLPV